MALEAGGTPRWWPLGVPGGGHRCPSHSPYEARDDGRTPAQRPIGQPGPDGPLHQGMPGSKESPMSTRAEEFVTTIENDPRLQARLSSAATSDDRKQVVSDAGYGDVSAAEVRAVITGQNPSDELTDDQLAAASGAGGFAMYDQPLWSQTICGGDGGW